MKLQIDGAEFRFEQDVDVSMARKIVMQLMSQEDFQNESLSMTDTELSFVHSNVSLRAFVKGCSAQRIPDKIVAIGSYWKKVRQIDVFSRKEIVIGFEELGEAVPKNLSRDIAWAKKIGWLTDKLGQRGYYYLTRKGEDVVESGFTEIAGDTTMRAVEGK